ncbi:TetR/AcrR family transcriptional regulator [Oceanobacter sp. 3_MG-2023]|uniref:acrylate utilization transcriptional regulator AcuR n=1 Tax=Oceanobacter sp. 3_MG-2023 TaxID=3062622 RepID=UPI002733666F|nr:TetR/AcrR family transcriptional regulator [Oceanobacter sp. 3_MG-2023]MDP2506552.1 TetR/AcrR family transcriptional regulator [Oceanobacter sp. 3_MG-2023]
MNIIKTPDSSPAPASRRRGRPPKDGRSVSETRALLVRSGVDVLTEQGFTATGIDQVLKRVGVPKGSFYHFFASKEAYVAAVVESYGQYFDRVLARSFNNDALTPLQQLEDFTDGAMSWMERHQYRNGCLVGNLGQEVGQLPDSLRQPLQNILAGWEQQLQQCLQRAQQAQLIAADADCVMLAHVFWVGWEGAVMRARLEGSTRPLRFFRDWFLWSIRRPAVDA